MGRRPTPATAPTDADHQCAERRYPERRDATRTPRSPRRPATRSRRSAVLNRATGSPNRPDGLALSCAGCASVGAQAASATGRSESAGQRPEGPDQRARRRAWRPPRCGPTRGARRPVWRAAGARGGAPGARLPAATWAARRPASRGGPEAAILAMSAPRAGASLRALGRMAARQGLDAACGCLRGILQHQPQRDRPRAATRAAARPPAKGELRQR
jgi:hypothetical protein